MVKLTKGQVLHTAQLSNLVLTDNEIAKFTPQLTKVIEFIGQLKEVNTDNVEPTTQTTGLSNITRKDEINSLPVLTKDKALSGTDNSHNGFFKVPAILEGRSDK
ncbi:MAG: Asp-tRNA(Asn)/Glu-tRNA(Gln) amidotransferase subunit GatC [bacterium]|nr:MAG: Asp-tRNA(Asn)/Glu-tRNA(Gln) amidotransferase subunit GatC [bacterium]